MAWPEIIEVAPEAAAALNWQRWCGPAFDAVAASCLRETKRIAAHVECENGCACNHRVQARGANFAGVCDCGEGCEDISMKVAEVKVWEFDLPKLGRAVAKALGCRALVSPMGFHRTIQVTALGNPAVPVMLTIQAEAESYRNAIAYLLAQWPKGIILLTPTKLEDAGALKLLTGANVGFYDLATHLELLPSGVLSAPKTGQELFATHLPEKQTALKQSEVIRIVGGLQKLKSKRAGIKAPLFDVFMAVVGEQMKYRPAAKKCGCSVGTLSDRIRELETKFGMPLKQLQANAGPVLEMQTSVKGERRRKRKPGSSPGAFADDAPSNDGDDSAPQEEYRYEENAKDD